MKMPKTMPLSRLTAMMCLTAPLLTACAVGPDFVAPTSPATATYGQKELPQNTASAKTMHGGAQRFKTNGDIPAAWWELYESAPLNHLITQAIKANPSLEAARASLRAAQETASAGAGGFLPSIEGNIGVNRTQAATGNPYTLYNATASISYAPDVFGGTRHSVEALEAQAEATRFELEAAYLTLTSNVVTTAIQEASLRAQLKATQGIIKAQEKQLKIMKAQWKAGAIAKPAYLAQKATVASTKVTLPALKNNLAKTRTLLSVLLGQMPSKTIPAAFTMDSFKLPKDVPVSLPSKLVEQRPDIRQARANLQKANAEIGVATAAMLPQFPLTGSYGSSGSSFSDMMSPTTALWGLGAGLVQPIFQGGTLLHTKRAAEETFNAQAALYRNTVLSGFKDVADALSSLEANAETLQAEWDAERAAKETLNLVTKQYNAGAVSYTALLSAQASHKQTKIRLIQAQAARLSGTATLLQALGGGWWNKKDTKIETTK